MGGPILAFVTALGLPVGPPTDSVFPMFFAKLRDLMEGLDMLRNLFLFVPFLFLVHVTSAVALAKCPGNGACNNCTHSELETG